MIEIEDVHKSFGALEVLRGVSLTVERGEVVSVIGGSGSGKSTLLMCVNGLEPVNSGRVLVDGTDVHARGTNLNQLRRKIGIVFQQWNAFPHLTVLENVMLAPRKVLKESRAEAEAIAAGAPRELAFRSFRAEVALALNLTERGVDRALSTAYSLVTELPTTLAAKH